MQLVISSDVSCLTQRVFVLHCVFPFPLQAAWRHDESVEQRILLRGLSHIGATLSFDDWIAHWSLLALNEPAVTQVRQLYLFGMTSVAISGSLLGSFFILDMRPVSHFLSFIHVACYFSCVDAAV